MILEDFYALERKDWGGQVERRRREFSSQNLERESGRENEYFGSKHA
jgi:hypothetical protein